MRLKINLETFLILFVMYHTIATTTQILDPLSENYRDLFISLWGKNSWIYPLILVYPILNSINEKKFIRLLLVPWLFLLLGSGSDSGIWGKNIYSFVRSVIDNEGIIMLNIFAFISIGIIYFNLHEHVKNAFQDLHKKNSFDKDFNSGNFEKDYESLKKSKITTSTLVKKDTKKKIAQKTKIQKNDKKTTKKHEGKPVTKGYHIPTELLHKPEPVIEMGMQEVKDMAETIIKTLKDCAGSETFYESCAQGRSVVRFEFRVSPSANLSKIRSSAENIAVAIASVGKVRIEAPVIGKSTIAVEIPQRNKSILRLSEVIKNQKNANGLNFIMGAQVDGSLFNVDLAALPHMLIAGATQSGKSVFVNTLLLNLIYNKSPKELKLILADMKKVELTLYKDIPHLLVPIVSTPDPALNALDWARMEVDRRYELLEESKTKNLEEYNKKTKNKLPYIVIVLEELSALLITSKNRVIESLSDLSERARAAGVHLIATMQRPDSKKLDGSVKANLPGKVSFRLGTRSDSITVFGKGGAENLLGRGDLYFDSPTHPELIRCQAPLVETEEIEKVLNYLIKNYGEAEYDKSVEGEVITPIDEINDDILDGMSSTDRQLINDIRQRIKDEDAISVSQLQRLFGIGYNKASRMMMIMEQLNWVHQDPNTSAGKKGWVVDL
ncbi:hypothetical protein CL643_02505 [bacterium]|nr:hypothetical protein [bacterium]|tara:strand:- start:16907 stop:18907 length:2001 start_codon:yes stop_codon:yes gene_type:complete